MKRSSHVFRVTQQASGTSAGGAGGTTTSTGGGWGEVELMVKVDDVENLGRFVQVGGVRWGGHQLSSKRYASKTVVISSLKQ
jgi:hypothetical protein